MTRKHFNAIAETIRYQASVSDADERRVIANLAAELAGTLAQFNPHFDRGRFIAACEAE
ncbi:MAG: hypothetical protein IIA10_04405 [Proteobacteria bacterium]|nr:hypothetical protein [Pseudomonadota bacterium]